MKLGGGNIFRSVCQQFCPQEGHVWLHRGGHVWFYSGVWMVLFWGSMVLFWGVWMVLFGGMCGFIWRHVWFYSGGMHGFIWGGVCGFIWGVCIVLFGGHVWFFQLFWIQWDMVNERAVRILLECILVWIRLRLLLHPLLPLTLCMIFFFCDRTKLVMEKWVPITLMSSFL